MHANAEIDSVDILSTRIALTHRLLHFGRAVQGIHNAGELNEEAVTRSFHEATAMLSDLWLDYLGADGPQSVERALLVRPDEARITSHICGKDGSKATGGRHCSLRTKRPSELSAKTAVSQAAPKSWWVSLRS
jgi:hypothetical protein